MITVGFSTRKIVPEYIEHIKHTSGLKNIEIIPLENNGQYSLSEAYNLIIKQSSNDIVTLIHDDLIMETKNWGHKLKSLFNKNKDYGIIGLAGSKYLPQSSMWWEIPETMYGIVNHQNEGKKWESKYSKDLKNKLEETVLVDGLFISFMKSRLKENFDERCEGFHFYDVYFSINNFLKGVKLGVTTSIRVTHLSIGQTNQEWEKNRQKFSERYRNHLPIDITNTSDFETFIIVHDQNIILKFEEERKFNNIEIYKYLFVGSGPIDKINFLPNVIICRNLEFNLEQYPNINAFTAWYALWKNNLITKKYINLLEYDTVISEKYFKVLSKMSENGYDILRFMPMSAQNYHFIDNPDWNKELFQSISKTYRIDLYQQIKNMIGNNPNLVWSTTSNSSFRTAIFNRYMEWFTPLLPEILKSKYAGHAHERSITYFSYMNKKNIIITQDLLKHYQLDSHKTQGHEVNFEESLKKISLNEK